MGVTRRCSVSFEHRRDRLRLAVGEDDEHAPHDAGREEVRLDERHERLERRRAPVVDLARRRAVDRDRLGERAREQRGVRRRHQVRERPVGHRRDADREVGQLRPQAQGEPLRACQPRRLSRAGRGLHRERRVEDEERLRVGALAHELLAHDDRLRRRRGDERDEQDERDRRRDDAGAAAARRPPARARTRAAARSERSSAASGTTAASPNSASSGVRKDTPLKSASVISSRCR